MLCTSYASGVGLVAIQQLLGHRWLTTTMGYVEATANELRDAIKAHPAQLAFKKLLD